MRFEDANLGASGSQNVLDENIQTRPKPYEKFRSSAALHQSWGFAARENSRAAIFAKTDSCLAYPVQSGVVVVVVVVVIVLVVVVVVVVVIVVCRCRCCCCYCCCFFCCCC